MKNINLLGVSGRKNSGKDTLAKIINVIVSCPHFTDKAVLNFIDREHNNTFKYQYKSFAGKLKQIVSLLTGYTLKQLEDREIKESQLGEEWWYWKLEREGGYGTSLFPYLEGHPKNTTGTVLVKPTVRSLLQSIGTDLFRNRVHPNIWVTALFADYKPVAGFLTSDTKVSVEGSDKFLLLPGTGKDTRQYPSWFITDVRFPNEMKAIQDRNGIVVRIKRTPTAIIDGVKYIVGTDGLPEHESETALDDCKDFDCVIINDGSLVDLVVSAREFIKQFKIK